MKSKIIKKISFILITSLLFFISFVFSTRELSSQNYYINNNEIVGYHYYKDVEVANNGALSLKGMYKNTLGEFLYAINSQEVYRVGYDKDGDVVKYYRKSREYSPRYSNKNGIVKEIHVKVPGERNDQIRIFSYEGPHMTQLDIYLVGIDADGISLKHIKDQTVLYHYNNAGQLTKITYYNYNKGRNVTTTYTIMHYNGKSLEKKEFYNEKDKLVYYFSYKGNKTIQHKPNNDIVREFVNTPKSEYTIEYYPAIFKMINGKYVNDAEDKYDMGQKIGFDYDNGGIYRFSKILPAKNGYTLHDYIIMKMGEKEIVVENIYYKRAITWKESTTLVQRAYLVIPTDGRPQIEELQFKWLDKKGNNLFNLIPITIKNYLRKKEELFIGAEFVLHGIIAEPKGGGPNTLVEIVNEKGQTAWADIYEGHIFFIGKLSDNNDLNYHKIIIRSKGYKLYQKEFQINKSERVIDLGQFYLQRSTGG